MSILDSFCKKTRRATQSLVKSTKDFTDTARLNSQIADERRQIENYYIQIGKIYHETLGADEDTPSGKLCMAIDAANHRITKYERDVLKIKGIKKCLACGKNTPINAVFCSGCGAKTEMYAEMPEPEPEMEKMKCAGCGTELDDDILFCITCGQKVE
jgi:hypothetical protein